MDRSLPAPRPCGNRRVPYRSRAGAAIRTAAAAATLGAFAAALVAMTACGAVRPALHPAASDRSPPANPDPRAGALA